jgi:hypothetical protein
MLHQYAQPPPPRPCRGRRPGGSRFERPFAALRAATLARLCRRRVLARTDRGRAPKKRLVLAAWPGGQVEQALGTGELAQDVRLWPLGPHQQNAALTGVEDAA